MLQNQLEINPESRFTCADFGNEPDIWTEPVQEKIKVTQKSELNLGDIVHMLDGLMNRFSLEAAIQDLNLEIINLKSRCENLERSESFIIPIQTLAPEQYELAKSFNAVVRLNDDQYIASFFDANLSTSGDTPEEAVMNLKDLIVGTYEILSEMADDELGPVPLQQKIVLSNLIELPQECLT